MVKLELQKKSLAKSDFAKNAQKAQILYILCLVFYY